MNRIMDGFQFQTGDVVLAEWTDKLFYAKILHINYIERTCTLLFDDDSVEHCPFSKIHSVTETTAEIVCIVCKDGTSVRPNEIVLCDKCGLGYHQKCHNPGIEDKALEPEEPWMCVYCSDETECPYLLNPFETNLKNLTSMSARKTREDSKDKPNIPSHSPGFTSSKPSRVRNLMANYYHDSYTRRPRMDTNTSHVMHVTSDHHVMSRRGMLERQGPRNNYYLKYPDEKKQRLEEENLDSRKQRLRQQEKQKTTQDVWDNGYSTSCDVTANDVMNGSVDDKLKMVGKEGPREKQRLTQDLERQRKKLEEDMQRGQELQREQSQRLTRDTTHDIPRDMIHGTRDHRTTSEDVARDDDRQSNEDHLTRKYDRRPYSRDHIVRAEYHEENMRTSSGLPARGRSDCSVADDSSYTGKHYKQNGAGHGDETGRSQKLDPCKCVDAVGGTALDERLHRLPAMQCGHSSSRETYHEVNGHANEVQEHASSENSMGKLYSSEKIEVLGESNDLGVFNAKDESEKMKTTSSVERVGHKRQKSSEGPEPHGLRKERRTKEGSNGSAKSDKGSLKESTSGSKRSSCSDEFTEHEHGGSKTGRNKTMNQDGGKKQQENEYESDITQNRVRSDLPRHNWLVERWINQKNVSADRARTATAEHLKDSREVTSTNTRLESSVMSTSPVFEEKYRDEVLDEGYTKRNSDDERADSESRGSVNDNPILKVPSPVKFENDPLRNSPEIRYSPPKQEQNSPQSLNNGSPEIKQYSPVNQGPSSPSRAATTGGCDSTSPQRVQASYDRRPSIGSLVSTSPKSDQGLSPRVSETETRVPASPNLVATTSNSIPASPNHRSPNIVTPSPHQIPPSPSRILASPVEKTITRPSSIDSGTHIEARQISSRFNPQAEQELGGSQGASRTKWDKVSSSEGNNGHNEHLPEGDRPVREISSADEERKIIEVSSDGEENKRASAEENKELSKIQTGKSVNPVSPIVRADRHVMDEMHPGMHEARPQGVKPLRVPAELPPGLPFVGSAYVSGYPPKTFTPHLITHNAAGMPTPVSPIMRHGGHPALQGRLPGRLELTPHARPDMNCPFHGKQVDKIIPHVPGYPIMHGDAHMFPHPLHEGLHEPMLKVRDKRPEHVDFQSDPLAMQRRLTAVYDHHLVMPPGLHMHHPRYLTPGFIDEHGYPTDSERYKHRLHEAAHAYTSMRKSKSHTPGGSVEDISRYAVSPSEEKRIVSKYPDLQSQDKREDIVIHPESYHHHHRGPSSHAEGHRDEVIKRYDTSTHDMRSSTIDHGPRTRSESPVKAGKYSPVAVRQATPKNNHPGFIQLGEGKTVKEKPGLESGVLKPSPSPSTLDRESISRDFSERINILDKTFKEKLEGTDRSKEEAIATYSAHRRHGLESGATPRAWSENLARGVDPLKCRPQLEKQSPISKASPPGNERKLHERTSPRGMVTSSTHKPTVPMPSYRFHGGLVTSPPHVPAGLGRGMVGVPIMANHGEYAVWQGMRGPTRIPAYPPVTKEPQGLSAVKSERVTPDHAAAAKREYQEKERSLAMEKHRMNLAQLENERRKAFMATTKNERMDERRPGSGEADRRSPRTREEELRRNWEHESRKRKLEGMQQEVQPHSRVPEINKGLIPDKAHHLPDELTLRKEHYLAMYARQHDPYGQYVPGVPYPDRVRSAGNPYISRMEVQRGQAEQSVTEALRKQREYNERQEAIRKMVNQDREHGTSGEPAKKRIKHQRCMCGVCGKEASFLCSGCQKAWYCSTKCQHTAWADHSKECTETKRK